jgi:hypothetical protein
VKQFETNRRRCIDDRCQTSDDVLSKDKFFRKTMRYELSGDSAENLDYESSAEEHGTGDIIDFYGPATKVLRDRIK